MSAAGGLEASLELLEIDRRARLERPLRTFDVCDNEGGWSDITAASWELSNGALIFRDNAGAAFLAIAQGYWSEVRDR